MTYIQKTTLKNLVVAAMLVAVGHSLQMYGMTTLATRSTAALQVLLLSAYEWTAAQSVMVQMVYQMDIWYFGALADTYLAWAFLSLMVVAGFYRYLSARLAALLAVVVLVGTVNFGVPVKITQEIWARTTGHETPYSSVKKSSEAHASVAETPKDEAPSELEIATLEPMPFNLLSFAVVDVAAIYNVVRMALGPILAVCIMGVLLGSVRRRRVA